MTSSTRTATAAALAQAILSAASRFRARGWCDGTSGNFSAVLERDPLALLITPSGVDKGCLAPGDLLTVGPDGTDTNRGTRRPSAEAVLHVELARRAGPTAGAILHTHTIYGTLLGERFRQRGGFHVSGYEMLKGLAGVTSHEDEVFVPVVGNSQDMPGLARTVGLLVGARPELRGVLIAGHGLYAWGRDVEEAYRHVEIFEFLFRLLARRVSFEPFSGEPRSARDTGGR